MSNFFCENAYMDSRSYYDGEQSWDEHGCEEPQYNMHYYYEESYSVHPYYTSYDDKSSALSKFYMPKYYEAPSYTGQSSCYRLEEKQYHDSEPSLASLLTQVMANQAQIQKDSQLIREQFDQLKAHNKLLEIQVALQASSESMNQDEFPSQSDSFKTINSITSERGRILEEPQSKVKVGKATIAFQNDHLAEYEEEYREPPACVPPIPFPQRLKKSILENQVKVNKKEQTNRRYTSSKMIEHEIEVEEEENYVQKRSPMVVKDTKKAEKYEEPPPYVPKVPFPQRLKNKEFPVCPAPVYYDHKDTSYAEKEQVMVDSLKDVDFWYDYSGIKEMFDEEVPLNGKLELKAVETPKDQDSHELCELTSFENECLSKENFSVSFSSLMELIEDEYMVDINMDFTPIKKYTDPFLQECCPEVDTSLYEYFEDEAPKIINERLDVSVPIEFKGAICKKGLNMRRKVHSTLDGRKLKWDLKVN